LAKYTLQTCEKQHPDRGITQLTVKCCHEVPVNKELTTILDEWIESYQKERRSLPSPTNKKYSGKFILRSGEELHEALALQALNEGECPG
jgi:predicted HicB family RNase H-like nuclease